MEIDDSKVERAFAQIRTCLNLALQQDLHHLEALVERLRVELMVQKHGRDRRHVYRSIIDLLEGEIERRYADDDRDRDSVRQHVVQYFRRLLSELSDSEK